MFFTVDAKVSRNMFLSAPADPLWRTPDLLQVYE
jgi:hypothetical protein